MTTKAVRSTIQDNPFWILGVTPRDSRQAIVQKATERALTLEEDECQSARTTLTNPRARVAAELSWFPGLSPKRADDLIARAAKEPLTLRGEPGLPALARANLLSLAVDSIDGRCNPDDLARLILNLADTVDRLDTQETMRDVNEDRSVSGFPAIADSEMLDSAIEEHRRRIHDIVKGALDRLPTDVMVGLLTKVVSVATKGGQSHAPELIDLLVDSYEVAAQQFLQAEAANVSKLTAAASEVAGKDRGATNRIINALDQVVRNWDRVAQPIQLSAKARGLSDTLSRDVAFGVRSFAVELFNEHNFVAEARRLTGLLQELFAELPQVAERLGADSQALDAIAKERADWARSITYSADVGVAFKGTLGISPHGVSWRDQSFPLESITRVRWGGTKHSINGIPTGTTYLIGFGDSESEAVVEIRRQEVYDAFLRCLWRAVCVRLVRELAVRLKAGYRWSVGGAVVGDEHVVLMRSRLLRASEPVACNWGDVRVGSANGAFVIVSATDAKVSATLSYTELPNIHILEQLVQLAFKNGGGRLSDILDDEDD